MILIGMSENYSSTHHFILNYATLLGDHSPFVFHLPYNDTIYCDIPGDKNSTLPLVVMSEI